MKDLNKIKKIRPAARPSRQESLAAGIPYTMKLADGRIVFVEVPRRMVQKDRSGELAFTPDGVQLLDRVRALSLQPSRAPSPAYLAALRESLGMTQAELGRAIGRDKLTISRWECGSLRPSAESLEKLYSLARRRKQAGVVLAG